ncbi:MAG TPA: hypothetical protein VEY92_08525 [Pseudoxanthomonas sp.]|nr:hypothetical protein [Pseudoxanthomonas sp.]
MSAPKEWRQALGDMLKLMMDLQLRFKSGNSVEVERTYFTRKDWQVLQDYMEADEAMSTDLGMENWNLRQERAGEWQPIETAPKGRRVLVRKDGKQYAADWVQNPWTGEVAWCIGDLGDGERVLVMNPDEWMELPK